MSVLFAGFAAFPGAPFNPSGDLMAALCADPAASDLVQRGIFSTCLLPVSWDDSWPLLRQAIAAHRADTVVLFGLHMKAERLRVELLATNRRELGREDAKGQFPAGPIIGEGPPKLRLALPWSDLAAILRQRQIDFEWSSDAGGYLCNDTLYRLAGAAASLSVRRFGFIHVPMTDERIGDCLAAGSDMPSVFNSINAVALLNFARSLAERLAAGDH